MVLEKRYIIAALLQFTVYNRTFPRQGKKWQKTIFDLEVKGFCPYAKNYNDSNMQNLLAFVTKKKGLSAVTIIIKAFFFPNSIQHTNLY